MSKRVVERSDLLMGELYAARRKGKELENDKQLEAYAAEGLTNIGEAALLEGANPDKVLEQVSRFSGTKSLEILSYLHGLQDDPEL